MDITKASGEKQVYNRDKLCGSLLRAGVSRNVVNHVCEEVEKKMRSGITTGELFEKTSQVLRRENPTYAAKYSLRKAMMELGPQGFLFEQFVAGILKEYGYQTKNNLIMRGDCVSHEIDILAKKEKVHYLVEVKYHNRHGVKSDVQVVMYMYARLLDIAKAQEKREATGITHEAWVFTNTKFTSKAARYAQCMGIKLTGWRHPKKESLEHLIAQKMLYPVTVLPSVNTSQREALMAERLLFVKDILVYSKKDLTRKLHLDPQSAETILREAGDLIR